MPPSTHTATSLLLPLLLLLLLFTSIAHAQDSKLKGKKSACDPENVCNGIDQPCQKNLGVTSLVRLTVELNNNVDSARFYQFCIPVDQLSQISIADSFDYMLKDKDSYVQLHIGEDFQSTKRHFFDEKKEHYAAFLTSIINVDNGLFFNGTLAWDSSCAYTVCVIDPMYQCIRELDCGMEVDPAEPPPAEDETRGVKVMVAFAGYDNILNPLTSAGSLPTKFRAFAWSSYIGQLTSMFLPSQ